MNVAEEASAILIRMFETVARGMNKRLLEEHKTEIRRACALLSQDGTLAPLEDLPKANEYIVPPAEIPVEVKRWKERREERERG